MHKTVKILLLVLLGTVITGGLVVMAGFMGMKFMDFLKPKPDDKGPATYESLVYCSYSESGGMSGGHLYMTLERTESGEFVFSYNEQAYWNSEETQGRFPVSADAMGAIEDIFNSRRIASWGELPESEIFALDAPSVSVTLRTGGESYSLSDRDEFPEGGSGVIHEIYSVLTDCKNKKYQ